MPPKFRVLLFTVFIFIALTTFSYSQQEPPLAAMVNDYNVNVRSDSTVTSSIICIMNEGEYVEIVSKAYEWYKIRLPKEAPSYIKREFLVMLDDKTAKVSVDSVNVRLKDNDSSPIIGKVKENEVVSVLSESRDWCRIVPVNNSFGWIHSRFLKKFDKKDATAELKAEEEAGAPKSQEAQREEIAVQGVVKPKTIRRIATHKLITEDNGVFLLKGNKESLDALNYRKVKISGKRLDLPNQEYPIIEITKMEALD